MRRLAYLLLLAPLALAACDGPAPPATTAFVDVTVLPMDGPRTLPHHTVVVDGPHIVALGPVAEVTVPDGARVVAGDGLFLMPGLVDMHVHNWLEQDHALFLRWGVTTIRNMSGRSEHRRWRSEIDAGKRLGPAIYTAGPVLDGDPPVRPDSVALATEESALDAVVRQEDAGWDFVKVYSVLRPDVFRTVLSAAREMNLHVTGHVPLAVPLADAFAWGLGGVEHLSGYRLAMQEDGSPLTQLDYDGWRALPRDELARLVRRHLDPAKLDAVVELTCKHGVVNTPTLITGERLIASPDELAALGQNELMRYVAPFLRAMWDPERTVGVLSDDERLTLVEGQEWHRRLVVALDAAGCGVLLGTDTPGPFSLPGRSAHEELELLVEAGLSPAAALAAGTVRAADVVLATESARAIAFGRVVVGARADLLLLQADPLDDIANTRRIRGVMTQGRYLPRDELEALAEDVARFFVESPDVLPSAP